MPERGGRWCFTGFSIGLWNRQWSTSLSCASSAERNSLGPPANNNFMQLKLHLSSSPSAVSLAERKPESAKPEARAVTLGTMVTPRLASVRIREAREAIADIVLEDDMEHENGLLLSSVAVDLNEILLELDRLSGLQRMFEAVMQGT